MQTRIDFDKISFSYKDMNILNEVTLTLYSGDIVALIGDNGCGKTTFLELIAGFFKVQSGVITYYESDKKSLPKLSGFFEMPRFWNNMTGRENLKYFLGTDYSDKRINEALIEWKLDKMADKVVRKYSMGMRQKLALAMAFLSCSNIILLDEPLNTLDQKSLKILFDNIHKAANEGKIIVFTTHIYYMLKEHCSKVLKLEDGLLTDITKTELLCDSVSKEKSGESHEKNNI